ncbi:MAG TPA: NADP-dependent oxidoreductase [Kofleriaceae bacterium]|jgi:NADPH:quinone reductase-like Zn-dependent oxidoreductase|nr:NADP-dependent oxidoreductase [Kofleriaceae bacterium]
MKAVRIHAYGHSDQLHVDDIPMPTPGAGEVLVRVHAVGVNPVDWKIREGLRARDMPRSFPFTAGQDFAGTVVSLGSGVQGIEASDVVYGFASGSYAEYAAASPSMIASKPRTVHDTTAAALPTPGLTALQTVRDAVQPQPEQTILIHGAAGGVGAIATQLCLARRARVIATAASRDAGYLRGLGVAEVVDYRAARFEDRARQVDAVIDLVGGDALTRSFAVLRTGGVVATTVGPLDPAEITRRGVRGVHIVMQKNAADLEELARLIDDGTIAPRPVHTMQLVEAGAAQDLLQTGHPPDKLVLAVV